MGKIRNSDNEPIEFVDWVWPPTSVTVWRRRKGHKKKNLHSSYSLAREYAPCSPTGGSFNPAFSCLNPPEKGEPFESDHAGLKEIIRPWEMTPPLATPCLFLPISRRIKLWAIPWALRRCLDCLLWGAPIHSLLASPRFCCSQQKLLGGRTAVCALASWEDAKGYLIRPGKALHPRTDRPRYRRTAGTRPHCKRWLLEEKSDKYEINEKMVFPLSVRYFEALMVPSGPAHVHSSIDKAAGLKIARSPRGAQLIAGRPLFMRCWTKALGGQMYSAPSGVVLFSSKQLEKTL